MKKSLMTTLSIALLSACQPQPEKTTSEPSANKLSAPAELVSLQDITIGPPNIRRMWQYKIQYLAKENALVNAGDVLVRFDGQQLRNRLIEKKSELDAAVKDAERQALEDKAKEQDLLLALAEAKMNQEKAQRKVEITDASRSEVERRKQQAAFKINSELLQQAKHRLALHRDALVVNKQVSDAKIGNLQAIVDDIRNSLQRLTIKAPKDGMVIYQADWEDDKPSVGDTIYMGRTLLSLPSIDKMAVKAEFDEADSAKIFPGQQVKVVLDAHPEKPFNGKITSLGQAYHAKSQRNQKVVFDANIELEELASDLMRPGMKASVEVLPGGNQ